MLSYSADELLLTNRSLSFSLSIICLNLITRLLSSYLFRLPFLHFPFTLHNDSPPPFFLLLPSSLLIPSSILKPSALLIPSFLSILLFFSFLSICAYRSLATHNPLPFPLFRLTTSSLPIPYCFPTILHLPRFNSPLIHLASPSFSSATCAWIRASEE